MLTVRVLPRRGVTLRAATASVEVSAGLVVGHVWAGGMLPSAAWVGLMAAAVFGLGLFVLRGGLRLRYAVPGLIATQLLMHAWLTALTPHGDMGSMSTSHSHMLLDPRMLAVHVGGALVTALIWELRARVVEIVVAWVDTALPPKQALPRLRALPGHLRLVRLLVVTSAPRRGPPVLLAPA